MLILCITNFSVIQLFLPVQTYLFPFKYGFYIRNGVKSLSKILRLFIWSQCLVYNVVFVNHRKRRDYWMYSAREEVHVYKKSWEYRPGSQCPNGADDTILSDRPSESSIVFLFCLFIFVCCIKLKFFYCLVLVPFQLKISTRDINHDEGNINCLK